MICLEVAADVPALGKLWLRLEVLVVAGQGVVRQPDVQPAIRRPVVAVQVGDVAEFGGDQFAPGFGWAAAAGAGAVVPAAAGAGAVVADGLAAACGAAVGATGAPTPHAVRRAAPAPRLSVSRNLRRLTSCSFGTTDSPTVLSR